jgi:hypothetical protein
MITYLVRVFMSMKVNRMNLKVKFSLSERNFLDKKKGKIYFLQKINP